MVEAGKVLTEIVDGNMPLRDEASMGGMRVDRNDAAYLEPAEYSLCRGCCIHPYSEARL